MYYGIKIVLTDGTIEDIDPVEVLKIQNINSDYSYDFNLSDIERILIYHVPGDSEAQEG